MDSSDSDDYYSESPAEEEPTTSDEEFIASEKTEDDEEEEEEDIREVTLRDLTPEERRIMMAKKDPAPGKLRRSGRKRKEITRYRDPEYGKLMTDNGKDLKGVLDDEEEEDEPSDETWSPGFEFDQSSAEDSDSEEEEDD